MLDCVLLLGNNAVLALRLGPKIICSPLSAGKTAALSGAGYTASP